MLQHVVCIVTTVGFEVLLAAIRSLPLLCFLHVLFFGPEDGGDMFLRNEG
jgi:hypothetical protein